MFYLAGRVWLPLGECPIGIRSHQNEISGRTCPAGAENVDSPPGCFNRFGRWEFRGAQFSPRDRLPPGGGNDYFLRDSPPQKSRGPNVWAAEPANNTHVSVIPSPDQNSRIRDSKIKLPRPAFELRGEAPHPQEPKIVPREGTVCPAGSENNCLPGFREGRASLCSWHLGSTQSSQ
jgi:hypothetical protein